VRITNDTGSSLPAGVLTLYDPASPAMFAGDARLGGLPAGESRLLSFAEDLRTAVVWKQDETLGLAALAAAQGVLRLDERSRRTVEARIIAPAAEPRDLLVEVAKPPGYTLVPDAALAPAEETATAWRFALTVAAGESKTLTVRMDRINRQSIALLQGDPALARITGLQGLDPKAREALQKLVELRAAQAGRQAEMERIGQQFAELEADQERVRKNLGAVPPSDALHGRLLRQLEALETRMEAQRKAMDQARSAMEQARRDYEQAAGRLTL
jgi:hypothetical protein